ncbi:MAG: hypothetical protein KAW81_04980 [Dehalococcoidia bacterium]|nr:hypothetical protein [Dehalococcoidia bacterium]
MALTYYRQGRMRVPRLVVEHLHQEARVLYNSGTCNEEKELIERIVTEAEELLDTWQFLKTR